MPGTIELPGVIDIMPDAIKQAKQNFPKGKFYIYDIEKLDFSFDGQFFDYILLPDVL